jgi:hypothetical protein
MPSGVVGLLLGGAAGRAVAAGRGWSWRALLFLRRPGAGRRHEVVLVLGLVLGRELLLRVGRWLLVLRRLGGMGALGGLGRKRGLAVVEAGSARFPGRRGRG